MEELLATSAALPVYPVQRQEPLDTGTICLVPADREVEVTDIKCTVRGCANVTAGIDVDKFLRRHGWGTMYKVVQDPRCRGARIHALNHLHRNRAGTGA